MLSVPAQLSPQGVCAGAHGKCSRRAALRSLRSWGESQRKEIITTLHHMPRSHHPFHYHTACMTLFEVFAGTKDRQKIHTQKP